MPQVWLIFYQAGAFWQHIVAGLNVSQVNRLSTIKLLS
jgi:hypothetical protein